MPLTLAVLPVSVTLPTRQPARFATRTPQHTRILRKSRASALRCRAFADPSSSFDMPKFDQVDPSERKAIFEAIDKLGLRCTAADVAAASGLDVATAERHLQSLVSDVQGNMKV